MVIARLQPIFYDRNRLSAQEPIVQDNAHNSQPDAELGSLDRIDSATLARLIEEVRNEEIEIGRNYDRTHNRHNR